MFVGFAQRPMKRGDGTEPCRMDALRSVKTMIGTVATLGGLVPVTPMPITATSISNLKQGARPLHSQIFPEDVGRNFGVTCRGDTFAV